MILNPDLILIVLGRNVDYINQKIVEVLIVDARVMIRNFLIGLIVSFFVTGCAVSGGRNQVLVTGAIENYEQFGEIQAVYINELLLVPFPKNLTTMSTNWPVAKMPVGMNGEFGGTIFVCGPITVSFPGYISTYYKTGVEQVHVEIDLERDAKNFSEPNFNSNVGSSFDEKQYQQFLQVASSYESLKDVPCYPDFE